MAITGPATIDASVISSIADNFLKARDQARMRAMQDDQQAAMGRVTEGMRNGNMDYREMAANLYQAGDKSAAMQFWNAGQRMQPNGNMTGGMQGSGGRPMNGPVPGPQNMGAGEGMPYPGMQYPGMQQPPFAFGRGGPWFGR